MIDIKKLRENPDYYRQGAKNKGRNVDIDRVVLLDSQVRQIRMEVETLRHKQSHTSGQEKDRAILIKKQIKELTKKVGPIEKELNELLYLIPNPPADFVPSGGEEANQVIRTVGAAPRFDFKPKSHIELGQNLGILDFARAAKVSGSRFVALKNQGAFLQRALMRFTAEKLVDKGFDFILPPHLIRAEAMRGMGYLEHGGDSETYYLPKDDMYLIGTSEQVLGPMRAGEIFEEAELPYRASAFSPCYRREAGSYGKDTRGMFRVHQFDKIEMFSFCAPQDSEKEHQRLLEIEEEIVSELGIPYRVVLIAAQDLGDPAAAKYDIEAWFPGQGRYREITSTSNTTDFQARRLDIRYKTKSGKIELVHMLNGTGSSDRLFIAVLENYQQKDGSIKITKALVPYFGKENIANENNN